MNNKDFSLKNQWYYDLSGKLCEEQWKDIPGYEGLYKISDTGRVKSLSKIIDRKIYQKLSEEIIMKKGYGKNKDYETILLQYNGKFKIYGVHQVVAMAFLNHIPCGQKLVVNHKDNVKNNNYLYNIEIITTRKNSSIDKKNKSSSYTGVSWTEPYKKFVCYIRINKKVIFLGCHKTNDQYLGILYKTALANINRYNGNNKEFRDLLKKSYGYYNFNL
jgi:hypothetical protein